MHFKIIQKVIINILNHYDNLKNFIKDDLSFKNDDFPLYDHGFLYSESFVLAREREFFRPCRETT